jgi:hypothetical protein
MKFAFFDENGSVVSAHNDDTVFELPKNAVALGDEQWENRCNLRLIDGEIEVVVIETTREDAAATVRRERNRLLVKNVDSCNPLRWENMSEDGKAKIRKYREALLNVPEQEGFPFNIEWPVL